MLTPMKAIRAKCLDCSCGSPNEVKLCPVTACPLFHYRFGKNPNRAGIGNHSAIKPNSANDFVGNAATEGTYTTAAENAAERPGSPSKEKPFASARQD